MALSDLRIVMIVGTAAKAWPQNNTHTHTPIGRHTTHKHTHTHTNTGTHTDALVQMYSLIMIPVLRVH